MIQFCSSKALTWIASQNISTRGFSMNCWWVYLDRMLCACNGKEVNSRVKFNGKEVNSRVKFSQSLLLVLLPDARWLLGSLI
ncbi:Caspase-1 [Manis pentadactyla]|nr:Caspase-1 [Manis pentadactyla]